MAGVFWERHFQVKLKEAGFVPAPRWECLFAHWDLQCMLSVYVDDFKMAGAIQNLKKAWDAIRKTGINIDDPTLFAHYLGCSQHTTKISATEVAKRLANISDLLPEQPSPQQTDTTSPGIKSIVYDMEGFIHQCVDRYCELAKVDKSSLKSVPTPNLDDHQIHPAEFESPGRLGYEAATFLMKPLYCTRLLRFDLLWTLCKFAREVTK